MSNKIIDLTGKRFGMLTVLQRAEKNMYGKPAWECKCDCGKTSVVCGDVLRRGDTKSCGCMRGVRSFEQKNPEFRRSRRNKLYNLWSGIIYRCSHESASHYEYYGGKGVSVCKEWEDSFEAFAKWSLCNGYKAGLEIDRIDNNLSYSPENCRFITHKENSRNRGRRRTNQSGCTGVQFRKNRSGNGGKWRACIMVDGKNISLGHFDTIEEAISARKAGELMYWGFNPIR